jgi:hypothetical protein
MLQELLARLHQEHGPLVKVWTGPAQLLVSVKDVDILQHVFERAQDRVPVLRMALQLLYGRRSLFTSNYSKASQSRMMVAKEINGIVLRQAHISSIEVAEKMMQLGGLSKNGCHDLDCMTFSRLMAFAALGTSLYGDGYMIWPVAREFERMMMEVMEALPIWMRYSVPPLWNAKFVVFWKQCLRLRDLARELAAHGNQTSIQESEDRVEGLNILTELLGEFVSALFSSMGMGGSTVAEPVAAEMMSHGSLNTAGVLCNVLAQLARHPHIQTKVHNEISTISGLDKSLTETDVQKMIYLNATVLEAARLLPTAPFLQRCSDEHDIALLPGVVIPAGAILTAPIQLIQRDTVYWGDDAAIFNPDRFLKPRRITSGELASEQNQSSPHPCNFTKEPLQLNPAFLVFGAGSRSCIGSSLAVKQISILVTVILKRFELKENFDSSDAKAYENMSRSPPRLTLSPR